ncbi:hypothetical protein I8752_09780 [Nostocaceae cyanobacterium CENA369]|uniref:Uncharacterized protein n=1 Tax=Dendronalium phyllosphericum CENA369 TaxID=1725256 RepID=A0A8J7I6N0_9NOST|nr:hypothetical protein [Dendronalium phyllosphericum]MBH8573297.1 hypothetical protein [Dendronalium phyllosphericum CENA369]
MKSLFRYLRAIATMNINADGRFYLTLGKLKAGDRSIKTANGTSKPAVNTPIDLFVLLN